MPTVQNATAPTRKSATAAPAMGPNMPMASGAVNPLDGAPAQPAAGKSGGFWDDILKSLLGVTSVAGAAAMRSKGGDGGDAPPSNRPQKAQPRAIGEDGKLLDNPYPDGQKRLTYEPKLPDESGKKMPSGAPELDQKGVNKEVTKMMQPEIDAENAQNNSIIEQMRKRAADEAATADLVKKAKRAVGRK